ncbi:DUF397 domain-containing protein [Micromonospora sp. WMMD558]|uniref:DUF397 domain-containing protein n=1 Tax=unclassified Micromonospora TaxID=2617518 RepID=UPI001E4A2980|nr:DUF397 domain-containing protein [Micromonospora sp. WMMC415]
MSSRSGNGGNTCVEVADNLPDRVLVRDSTDRGGAVLTFAPSAWHSFVELVKSAG